MQVLELEFGQQGWAGVQKVFDGQPVVLVIVLVFDVARRRAHQDRAPHGARQVHAQREAVGMRQWIHQCVHQMGPGTIHLGVFAAHGIDAVAAIAQERGDFIGVQSGCVYHAACFDAFALERSRVGRVADFDGHDNRIASGLEFNDARVIEDIRAAIDGDARIGFHERFGFDDAGGGHLQRGHGGDVRFALANPRAVHHAQAFDAIGPPVFRQLFEFGDFRFVRGDDQLAAIVVRHAVRGAKLLGHDIAGNAQPALQRSGPIVDARMHHAAIARAGGHAQLGHLLEQKDVLGARGDLAGQRAAHHSSADDDYVGSIHGFRRPRSECAGSHLE